MKQPNLQEYAFAMKVAYGTPQRDAYIEVFGGNPKTPREINAIDARASRLAARAAVAALIADERKLKGQRISAEERRLAEAIRRNIGKSVLVAQANGETLKLATLKGAELYLKSTGQFAPEEHILKNGGMAPGAFVPKGVEGMSRDDLLQIIEAEAKDAAPARGARDREDGIGPNRGEARAPTGEVEG